MRIGRKIKWGKLLAAFLLGAGGWGLLESLKPNEEERAQIELQKRLDRRTELARALAEPLQKLEWPPELSLSFGEDQKRTFRVTYTLEPHLQKMAEDLLKRYKPDYGAIFLMEATSGRVLAFASYQKDSPEPVNLVSRASYPAASVFKIVTATAAVDKAGVPPSHTIRFNGGNYTLYKSNVMSDRINRWTRTITLKDAFARSINTAFGRLSLETLAPEDLEDYANRFMFNQDIPADFPVDKGTAQIPHEKSYELTEVASGFNRTNRMSPVQGAMIAASVINGGRMLMPYVVDRVEDQEGRVLHIGETLDNGSIMAASSADSVRELMEETILSGTSRKSFRPLVRDRKFREIEIGGKTGHLTGDNPRGRADWFVGYASDDERKIAVAALTVNKEYWTVKSSHLGKVLFKKYFEPVLQSPPRRSASASER